MFTRHCLKEFDFIFLLHYIFYFALNNTHARCHLLTHANIWLFSYQFNFCSKLSFKKTSNPISTSNQYRWHSKIINELWILSKMRSKVVVDFNWGKKLHNLKVMTANICNNRMLDGVRSAVDVTIHIILQ